MCNKTFRYRHLESLVENVYEHFADLEEEGLLQDVIGEEGFYRLQWAVHEWMANLVQHAEFGSRTPEVQLTLHPNEQSVRCTIQDNSDGFDLEQELALRSKLLEPLPERGMGLLILDSCTQDLTYERLNPTRNCLEFFVSTQQDPWINIPFSS